MKMGLNPGGHSVIQRFEYWKTAVRIISKHFIFGVGTGDVKQAFIDEYQSGKSVLAPQYQHRPTQVPRYFHWIWACRVYLIYYFIGIPGITG
ncbi:MAG: O-antigen ligase family protein [Bacteroidales bacterium]